MNILLVTGSLYPNIGNNANLLGKISTFLQNGNNVHIFSGAFGADKSELNDTAFGLKVHWCLDDKKGITRKYLYPLISKYQDKGGYSDALQKMIIKKSLKELKKTFDYDIIISTCEPFSYALAVSELKNVKKFVYIMDPPESISFQKGTPYRSKKLVDMLKGYDYVITTPFIHKALEDNGVYEFDVADAGFPMIDNKTFGVTKQSDEKINLLFCGWLYSKIRSPKFFLDIVERLDERFCVTFMGKECERLTERFSVNTKAEVITLPQQPYEKAIEAMANADILINIGNSVPVHMPSKTLEYINTGKPFVNFYKMKDCPTLFYTNRYPLCLNIYEGDSNIDEITQRFVGFCVNNKGKTVDREYILREYKECTPEYIAKIILERIGISNGRKTDGNSN